MATETPPPAADDVWKVYLTAAIGAFFLGISDYSATAPNRPWWKSQPRCTPSRSGSFSC